MQGSGLSGGNIEVERTERSSGTLLLRNERRIVVVWIFSFRKVALANMSKDDRINSMHVVCISFYICQQQKESACAI
jgi:hypothetical protein